MSGHYDPISYPYARPSERTDVEFLVQNLRAEDHAECIAGGTTAEAALSFGLLASRPCLTLLEPASGVPAAMLGVVKGNYDGCGKVWLLGTDAIERHPITFLRHSRDVLDRLYGDYRLLYNYTDVRNTLHHKWLKWLGFTFLRKVELTTDNYFYEFLRPR